MNRNYLRLVIVAAAFPVWPAYAGDAAPTTAGSSAAPWFERAEKDLRDAESEANTPDIFPRRQWEVCNALADAKSFESAFALYSKMKDDDFELRNQRRMAKRLAEAGRYEEAWKLVSPIYPLPSLTLIYDVARIETLAGKTDDLLARIKSTKSGCQRAVIELAAGTALSSNVAKKELFLREDE